jgi:hypothetical protein
MENDCEWLQTLMMKTPGVLYSTYDDRAIQEDQTNAFAELETNPVENDEDKENNIEFDENDQDGFGNDMDDTDEIFGY